ncbi:MAG TPA: TonB-dependent receptor [Rhodanobacteraceae bacterium]|nr:TonB-dependent receptor [Rhodanobacteraceae bacterium]
MNRFPVLFATLAALTLARSPCAEEAITQPTVQVTAARMAETIDATLADVGVITRDDIDASGARDVLDLLRLQAGVDLARSGGPGAQTSLFLRGTNSNQVLVLIDGVRCAAVGNGAFTFEQLPLDAVERIEIVRGPRASYWGSDAIGGVVQIFTRKLDGPGVALGYGSYRDAGGSAGIGHWSDAGGYSVQVGARHVGGFSMENPAGFAYDPDDDGFRNRNLAARGSLALGSQTLGATLLRSQGEVEFDQGVSHAIEQTAGVTLGGELATAWNHTLILGNAREDYDTPGSNRFLTRRDSLSWQNDIALSANQRVVAGFDYVHERGETHDAFADQPIYGGTRDNRALFAGWHAGAGAFDAAIAARRDWNSAFAGATTGSAAVGWRFTPAARAWLSIGEGFRAPDLNEQFSPGYGGQFAGNPDLEPERSRSLELGLDIAPGSGQHIGANLYRTRIRDLIAFTGENFRAENVDRATIDGAELTWDATRGDWAAHAAWTWQDPRDEDTGSALLRRAKQKVSGTLERGFGERVRAGVELLYSSRRDDFGGIVLPAYTLVNLRASIELAAAWRITLRLENLGDREYELVHGYNTAGRSGFVELSWRPQGKGR